MVDEQEAIVLKTEPSGESFLKLHLLSAEQGIFLCLKRVSKKSTSSTKPDLFDQAIVGLENSKQGTMQFVNEYQLTQRRDAIGKNYRSLSCASRLAGLLVRNAAHMPESSILFELTTRALDAFAAGKAAEIVLIKSLYMLLKDEGYPVRESWWPALPTEWREQTRQILNEPSPSEIQQETRELCRHLDENLTRWMRGHTDLIVSE